MSALPSAIVNPPDHDGLDWAPMQFRPSARRFRASKREQRWVVRSRDRHSGPGTGHGVLRPQKLKDRQVTLHQFRK